MQAMHGLSVEEVNDATPMVNQILTQLGVLGQPLEERARESLLRAVIAIRRATRQK